MASSTPSSNDKEAPKVIDFCDSWYYHDIENLPSSTRLLFEQYSGIPTDEVVDHIQKKRSDAFAVYPYPCIGQLRFLNLSLSRHPLYPELLTRLRPRNNSEPQQYNSLGISGHSSGISYRHPARPQTLLDLGCCLAQDLRKLVFDGVPSENLYGLDVERRFVDIGYELFRDAASLKSRFVVQDMLASDTEKDHDVNGGDFPGGEVATSATPPELIPLAALENRVSIIVANSFFHLYSYTDQLRLAKRVVRLLSPERGSLILGRQVGSSQPGEYNAVDNKGTRYSHDVASFRQFWEKVAEETGDGCKFRVEAVLDEEELGKNKNQGQNWSEPHIRRLRYGVWRE